jgi:hypothetical protein
MAASAQTQKRILDIFRQASLANRRTPGRVGNVIELSSQNCGDLMVTADLHGQRLTYQRLLEIADLGNQPRRHLIMQEVCHGGPTYPGGGGCMSHLMLEDMAALKVLYPDRFHFLLSNHELAELSDFPIVKSKRMLNLQFRCGIQEMYGPAADEVRRAYLDFIASCPLAVRLSGDIFICHSAPENVDLAGFDTTIFDRPLSDRDLANHGPVFQMVWGRDYRQPNAETFARMVKAQVLIHGHEPCPEGFRAPNGRQIILDCCGQPACYVILPANGKLTHAQVVERIQRVETEA